MSLSKPASASPSPFTFVQSNGSTGALGTWTFTWSGYSTSPTRCVSMVFRNNPDGSGGKPAGLNIVGVGFSGTYFSGQTGGSWTRDTTSEPGGSVYFNNAGVTSNGQTGAKTMVLTNATNPTTAGTTYLLLTTYSAAGSGAGACDNGSVVDSTLIVPLVTTPPNTVSIAIEPTLVFGVANKATACNGESGFISGAGAATSVSLGHVITSSSASGAQALTVTSNAGGGFAVYVRGPLATGNLHTATHNWGDATGTYASPATFGTGEFFGFTYSDSTASPSDTNPASASFIRLDGTNRQVMGSSTSMNGTGCVAFEAQSGTTTPPGAYTATAIYTLVPVF